jgi:hypothetical protein
MELLKLNNIFIIRVKKNSLFTAKFGKAFCAALIFLLLFGPKVNGIGDTVLIPILIGLVFFLPRAVSYIFSPPSLISLCLIIFTFAVALANNVYDLAMLQRYTRLFLHILAAISIASYCLDKYGETFILRCVVFSGLIAAGTSVLGLLFQDFNAILLYYFAAENLEQYTGIRYAGIVRTFTISAIFTLSTLFLIRLDKLNPMSMLSFILIIAVFWFGALLNARAGILIGLFGLLLYSFLMNGFMYAMLQALKLSILLVVIVSSFFMYLDFALDREAFQFISLSLKHAFEPFIAFRQSGQFTASSAVDYLSKFFWFQNETILQMMFGTGDFGRIPGQKIPTDNGWAFIFNGLGLVGVFLHLLLGASLIGSIKRQNPYRIFGIILFVCLSIYHLKESLMFGKYFTALPVFVYVLGIYYHKHSKKPVFLQSS